MKSKRSIQQNVLDTIIVLAILAVVIGAVILAQGDTLWQMAN